MDVSLWTLALGLVLLAFTANAFRPIYRPVELSVGLSFFPSWLTAELALHHAVVQIPIALWLARAGAARNAAGQVGLGLWALNVALLVFCWLRGFRARRAMDEALAGTLGSRWTDFIDRRLADRLPARPQFWRWVLPTARRRDVEVRRDVPFARLPDGRELGLDLFLPRERPTAAPALLFVHGGGWVIGHREHQGQVLLYDLAAQGWVCMSVEYRLSPRATFPDHLVDVKRGLAWLREHAGELGADPSFVVASGISAGAHLAALAALTPNDPEYQPGFEIADTSLAGCVPIYGVYDLADRERLWPDPRGIRIVQAVVMKTTPEKSPAAFDKASPLARVRADAPPFLVVHGTIDVLAPVAGARSFVRALRAVSKAPVVYAEIPGGQHAFDVFHSPRADFTLQGVYRFLAWLRSARR
ncbi:MAG: alpha/beta hydrolase [Deltaproteobacteria bacterium]|nr:alpha/beta hydrolase [Deltaproteobacteria bacterium]